jgi:hypothetical protein
MKLPRTTWHVWLTWLLLLAVSLFVIAVALTHDRWQSSSAPTPGYSTRQLLHAAAHHLRPDRPCRGSRAFTLRLREQNLLAYEQSRSP